MATWRVGSRVPQHVYRDDTPVCTVPAHTAAYIVRALNMLEALPTPARLREMAAWILPPDQDDLRRYGRRTTCPGRQAGGGCTETARLKRIP